jgi:hypothetical protein
VEDLEEETVAEVAQVSEVVVVMTEVQSQCTKQYVMNVTRVVKFLSVHQVISQYIVMIVSVVKGVTKLHVASSVMTVPQEENSMIDQLHRLQSQHPHQWATI